MARISACLDKLYLAGAWAAGGLLIALCLLVCYSILARLIGLFAGGATEFAGYAMAASTFLALAYTFRNNGHIRILLLIQRTSGRTRRLVEHWALAFMSVISGYLAYYLIRLVIDSYDFGERSEGADNILLWMPQTPMAAGAVIFALSVFHTLAESIFAPHLIDQAKLDHEARSEV